MFSLLLLAVSAPAPQQPVVSWTPLEAVRLIGSERYYGAQASPISMARKSGQTLFYTRGGLQGSLMGTERKEVNGEQGAFTWISALPGYSLWLPGPSTSHFAALLQPVRFSRQDLTQNRAAVEKALGSTMVRSSEERVGDRDCLALVLARKNLPTAVQQIWVDKETGLIVKQRDRSGEQVEYELAVDKLNTAPEFTALSFAPPEGSVRVKGPVDLEILRSPDVSATREAGKEIASKARELGATAWLRSLQSPAGFRYVETVSRNRPAAKPTTGGSALGAPELQPGGLPPGWSVSGRVDPANGTIDMQFMTPAGAGARVIVLAPKPSGDGSSFGISIVNSDSPQESVNLNFVSYIAPDGTLVIAPGNSAGDAEAERQRARKAIGSGGVLVQSDFMDLKSGDTVSFIQSRNVDYKSRLRGFAARETETRVADGLGETRRYEVSKPYAVRLLSWKAGDADYLLASSRLSFQELEDLARSTTPVRRIANE